MRIKKMYQGNVPENKILNMHSESQTDVYSCDYINQLSTYSTEKIETGTNIVTKTSGNCNLNGSSYIKIGKVMQLIIDVTSTSTVSNGSNLFLGKISDKYKPKLNTTGASYTGGVGVFAGVNTEGILTLRVAGGTAMSAYASCVISITYIIDD